VGAAAHRVERVEGLLGLVLEEGPHPADRQGVAGPHGDRVAQALRRRHHDRQPPHRPQLQVRVVPRQDGDHDAAKGGHKGEHTQRARHDNCKAQLKYGGLKVNGGYNRASNKYCNGAPDHWKRRHLSLTCYPLAVYSGLAVVSMQHGGAGFRRAPPAAAGSRAGLLPARPQQRVLHRIHNDVLHAGAGAGSSQAQTGDPAGQASHSTAMLVRPGRRDTARRCRQR
jgi:hypothetical protein